MLDGRIHLLTCGHLFVGAAPEVTCAGASAPIGVLRRNYMEGRCPLALARPPPGSPERLTPLFDEAIRESAVRWRQSGAEGVRTALADLTRRELRRDVKKPRCDRAAGTFGQALWVSGMCLIEAQAPSGHSSCDVDGWIAECADPVAHSRIQKSTSGAVRALRR